VRRPIASHSQAEVDAVLLMPKYVLRRPKPSRPTQCVRLKAKRIYSPARELMSKLMVDAHKSEREGGGSVRVVLIHRGERIRGIDWKVRRQFRDGTVVCGWHEHLWDDIHGDQVGHGVVLPPGIENDIDAMFEFACQRWNIHLPRGHNIQPPLLEAERCIHQPEDS